MRAFRVTAFDRPPELMTVDRPRPGPGEVLIRVGACGINFADLLMLDGSYQATPPLPFTPGLEAAGTVVACGEGVTELVPAQRVAAFGGHGGLAEYLVTPASHCIALPGTMDFVTAAAFQIAYGTSHTALERRAGLKPGETLLVLGAAGGVGLTAVELGALMGARVIAVARGQGRLAVARAAGAAHCLDSEAPDLKERLKALGGVDVIYDPVGGALGRLALGAARPEARYLVIGFASGRLPELPPNLLLVKNVAVIGHYWGGYLGFAPGVLTDSLRKLLDWHDAGRIKPHVSHVLPLEDSAAALDLLRSRRATGKVVVTMPADAGGDG